MWARPYEPTIRIGGEPHIIRPRVPALNLDTAEWTVSTSGLDTSGGTHYSDWVTLSGPPRAAGWFGFPPVSLSASSCSVACYAEVGSGDTALVTGLLMATVYASGGDGYRVNACPALFALTHGGMFRQIRWKVVAGGDFTWSQAGTTLYKYA